MTLGTGVVVRDGACLVVDSSRLVYKPDGTMDNTIVDDKMLFNESDELQMVAVHSGPSPVVRLPKALPDHHGDFRLACSGVWVALAESIKWAPFVTAERRTDSHSVLIAGGRIGEAVRLVHRATGVPPHSAASGVVVSTGLLSETWRPQRQPETMVEAIAAAMERFTTLMRRGMHAGLAWPAHVAWISPDTIETFALDEPRHECKW